jgi:hypothetical protein
MKKLAFLESGLAEVKGNAQEKVLAKLRFSTAHPI